MKKQFKQGLYGFSGVMALALAAPASAQTDDRADERLSTNDEIVVVGRSFRDPAEETASKLRIPLAETASQITVFSDDFLDDLGITNFTDAVNYVPGVSAYGNGYDGAFFFVARGFGVSNANALRINGAPIGGDFFFDPLALDRLEYIKGGQAAAYGEVSAGGFVNVALKEASADEVEGHVQLRYDTFNTIRGEITYGGPLNDSGTVRGIVGYSNEQSEEFYRDGDSNVQAVFTNLAADVTDRLTVQGSLYYDDRSSRFNTGAQLGEDLTDPLNPVYSVVSYPDDLFAAGEFSNVSSHFFFGQALAEYEISENHSLRASYSRTSAIRYSEVQELAGFGYGQYVDLTPDSPNFGEAPIDPFAFDQDTDTTYAELRWTGRFDAGDNVEVDFIVSGEYYKLENVFTDYALVDGGAETVNVFNPVRSGANPFEGKTFDGDFGQSNEVYSASFLGSVNLYDRLRLNFGVRYDDRKGRENTTDPDATDVFPVDNVSYTASAVYDIMENFHVYYAYGQGVEYNTEFTCDGQALDPEENESHEIGVKWEPTDRLIASVAVFDNSAFNAPSEIEVCPTGSIFTTGTVSGESEQFGEGIEFELIGNITDAWNISGGFAYIDDGNGPNPFVTPEYSLTLFTTYDFLDGPLKGFGVGGGLRYEANRPVEGDVFVPVNLADVATFDDENDPGRTINFPDVVELGDYVVIDLALYYEVNENIDLTLNIQNVNNEEYYSSFGDPFFNLIRQPPRSAVLTLDVAF